jgi:uncharacterized protein (TIGR01777 family)
MKVFITGGTGFVGTTLSKALTGHGHEVTVLDRSVREDQERSLARGVSRVQGDATVPGPWQERLAEHDVVINLAGASIFQRWNSQVKNAIRDSRILTTRNVVQAIGTRKGQQSHLFSASAVGYYGFHGDEELDEENPPGSDFLGTLAHDWESEALEARAPGVRVVLTRFGLVMGRRGGVLGQLVPLFRRYLGGQLGSGRQWFSWIHEEDLAEIFLFLLGREDIEGPVNCTGPNPVRNKDLTQMLSRALGKRVIVPFVPGLMLRLLLGEFATVILEGQRVIPRRLLDAGYVFRHPALPEALAVLVA